MGRNGRMMLSPAELELVVRLASMMAFAPTLKANKVIARLRSNDDLHEMAKELAHRTPMSLPVALKHLEGLKEAVAMLDAERPQGGDIV